MNLLIGPLHRRLLRRMLFLAPLVAACLSACASDATPTNSKGETHVKLQGYSTVDDDKQIIFFGYRADIEAQMAESLAGIEKPERWVRVEIPVHLMPKSDEESDFDLSEHGQANIKIRTQFSLSETDTPWTTLGFHSGDLGLSGLLRITGATRVAEQKPAVSEDGSKWGLAYYVQYRGPITIDGRDVPSANLDYNFGALFSVEVPGGAQ